MFNHILQRIRRGSALPWFALILMQLAISAFFQFYWLKDNKWADPGDMNIEWVSDGDYRAIQTSTASSYTKLDGRQATLILSSDPAERKQLLSSFQYQLVTPEGRWHGRASATMSPHDFRVWMGAATPIFSIALVGLFLTYPRRQEPAVSKLEREAFANA